MPDDDDLDAAVYQAEQDSQSSRAQSKFLPTLHFIETIVQGRSTLEFSVENDTFVQEFREIPQETDDAPNPLSQTAAAQWRLPAHVCLQALLTREAEWEKLVDESVSNAFHDVAVADPSFLQRRSLLAALKARVEQTCNSASSVLYTALELIKAKTFSKKNGDLNLRQAAYVVLFALWVQKVYTHAREQRTDFWAAQEQEKLWSQTIVRTCWRLSYLIRMFAPLSCIAQHAWSMGKLSILHLACLLSLLMPRPKA
jgi:hypothetical protein